MASARPAAGGAIPDSLTDLAFKNIELELGFKLDSGGGAVIAKTDVSWPLQRQSLEIRPLPTDSMPSAAYSRQASEGFATL